MKIREIDQDLLSYIDEGLMEISLTAVFENSCYGFYKDVLITLLPREKSLLPRSMSIEGSWRSNEFRIGQMLSVGPGFYKSLRLCNATKSLNLSLKGKIYLDLPEKKRQIKEFLCSSKEFLFGIGKVFDLTPRDEIGGKVLRNSMEVEMGRRIQEVIQTVKDEKEVQAKNIVGYGMGLTPSADDFLLGILSVLEASGQERKRERLKEYVLKHYEGTTEVSKYMLHYGAVDHIYPKFLQDFLVKSMDSLEDFHGFIAHGSTSGADLLAGVMVGIEIMMETTRDYVYNRV